MANKRKEEIGTPESFSRSVFCSLFLYGRREIKKQERIIRLYTNKHGGIE
jgi:hypothetical protein